MKKEWILCIVSSCVIVFLLLGFAAGVLNVMREAGVVRERKLND